MCRIPVRFWKNFCFLRGGGDFGKFSTFFNDGIITNFYLLLLGTKKDSLGKCFFKNVSNLCKEEMPCLLGWVGVNIQFIRFLLLLLLLQGQKVISLPKSEKMEHWFWKLDMAR